MIATGPAAGFAHATALICDDDLAQEAAGQPSDMRVMVMAHHLL